MDNDAFIAETPEAINLFGLIALKGSLRLQSKGITFRHINPRQTVRRLTGLKTNDYEKLRTGLQALIDKAAENPEARFTRG